MRAGFAQGDITPAVGAPLDGFAARLSPSSGIDIPLRCQVLWLESGSTYALLVALDALGLSDATCEDLAQRLGRELGVPPGQVILHCTHTHSGPMTVSLRGVGSADVIYLRRLGDAVVEAAQRAVGVAEPVTIRWGQAPIRLGINRRQHVPGVGTVLGRNPSGPCDDRVRVLQLVGGRQPICIFNHACHPYCLGPEHLLISPDFCGHAVAALERQGLQAMYLNGCAADIAPLRAFYGPGAASEEGLRLAGATIQAMANATELPADNLLIRSERLQIPYQPVPPLEVLGRELDQADRTVRDEDRANPLVRQRIRQGWEQWLDDLARAVDGDKLPPMAARASVLKVGPLTIAALPGEIFYETGLDLVQMIGSQTIVAGYCHGFIGYVPPAHAYSEGGYEPQESHRFIHLWKFDPEAPRLLCQSVQRLLGTHAVRA